MELVDGVIGMVSVIWFVFGYLNDLCLCLYGDKGGLEVLFEKVIFVLCMCSGDGLEIVIW